MAYTPPESDATAINFTEPGYTAPVSGSTNLNFTSTDYSPPESGSALIDFTEGGYTAPPSGSLTVNFAVPTDEYEPPDSGSALVNFTEEGYTPPVSGAASLNFELGGGEEPVVYWPRGNYWEEPYVIEFGKSVTFQYLVLDISGNLGHAEVIGLRRLEMLLGGSVQACYPPTDIDWTEGPNYSTAYVKNIFDTTLSKIDAYGDGWMNYLTPLSNIRLVIKFVDVWGLDGLRVNNYHSYGGHTTGGVDGLKISATKQEVTDFTYNGAVPGGAVIFDGTLLEHTDSNVIDEYDLSGFTFPDLVPYFDEPYGELDPMVALFVEEYLYGDKIAVFDEPWKAWASTFFDEDYKFGYELPVNYFVEKYGQQFLKLFSEPYGDAPVAVRRFMEPYGETYLPVKTIVEPYGETYRPVKTIVELYGDVSVPVAVFDELYRDARTPMKIIHEKYGDALVMAKTFLEPYGELLQMVTSFVEPWNMPAAIAAIFQEIYAVTELAVETSFEEPYAINDYTAVKTVFNEVYALFDGATRYVSQETSILIDGEYIDFDEVDLSMSSSAYLISGSVKLFTEADYAKCSLGDEVIVQSAGMPDIYLFIEAKSYSQEFGGLSYNLSVLSPTAKLDVPYTKKITRTFTDDIAASTLVQQMADIGGIAVDYRLVDWDIDANAISINNESPLEVIRKVAKAAGGIMQTAPDGSLIIMSLYPVPVSRWGTVEPDVSYDVEQDLLSIAPSTKLVDGYNAYAITDQGYSEHSVFLEEEAIDGQTKIIKGYRIPFEDGEFGLETSGDVDVTIEKYVNPVLEQIPDPDDEDAEEWETVEFLEFTGTTSKPIYEVVSFEWLSRDLGAFQISEDGTLTIIDQDLPSGESLLRIKYKTKYWKWTVTCPDIRKVQFYVPEIED